MHRPHEFGFTRTPAHHFCGKPLQSSFDFACKVGLEVRPGSKLATSKDFSLGGIDLYEVIDSHAVFFRKSEQRCRGFAVCAQSHFCRWSKRLDRLIRRLVQNMGNGNSETARCRISFCSAIVRQQIVSSKILDECMTE